MVESDSFPRQHARTQRFTLGAPRTITVSPDGARVLFCRSAAGDDPVNALWCFDRETKTERMLADPRALLAPGADAALPAEERARRERSREAGGGIVSYATDRAVEQVVCVLGGQLLLVDERAGSSRTVVAPPGVFDPRLDPTGQRVAYTAAGALGVVALTGGAEAAIVVAHPGDQPSVTWGLAEFVAAEEMGRSRGHWWSAGGDRLVATRVDTSAVRKWHIASPIDPAAEPAVVAYPAAGTTNASVSLHLIDPTGAAEAVELDWRRGTFEYLASVSWAPDSPLTVVAQTRDQQTLSVAALDAGGCTLDEVYRVTDPSWVELVTGVPRWHAGQLVTVEDRGGARRLVVDGSTLTPATVQVRSVLDVGDDGVLVTATTEPTEQHVARVGWDGSVQWLTNAPGVHTAVAGGSTLAITTATLDQPGSRTRIVVDGTVVGELVNHAEVPTVRARVQLRRSGPRELRTAVLFPCDRDLEVAGASAGDGPLPVLLDPYGGPHALRVVQSQNAHGVSQWFADQGYAVVVIDGRGTPARGPAWERAVRGDLAKAVLEDQVEGLLAVAEQFPERLDLSRVGIRGWSFGGYLAALAVLDRPDVFHAAVAGAPVTDWRLYDTHYTERYLGHPDEDPDAYHRSDLVRRAATLTRPLLLIHGLADDNVVAAHTLALSQALLEAGRPHQVLPLSGVTHMTPQDVVAENLLRLQLAFLNTHLR